MNPDEIQARIERFEGPEPTLGAMMQLHAMASHSGARIREVSELIEQDVALSVRVMRLANSAYFGFPRQVESLPEAVMVIGLRQVCDLVSCLAIAPLYGRPIKCVDPQRLWRHSCATAEATRFLNRNVALPGESVYLAGLLHDMGMVALAATFPGDYQRVVTLCEGSSRRIVDAEREVLGVDHGWAGSVLLRHWNFPTVMVEAVQGHHGSTEGASLTSAMIEVADVLVIQEGFGELSDDPEEREISETLLRSLKLTPEDLDALRANLQARRDALEALSEGTWATPAAA